MNILDIEVIVSSLQSMVVKAHIAHMSIFSIIENLLGLEVPPEVKIFGILLLTLFSLLSLLSFAVVYFFSLGDMGFELLEIDIQPASLLFAFHAIFKFLTFRAGILIHSFSTFHFLFAIIFVEKLRN